MSGYSLTTLVGKLGIKDGMKIGLVGAPTHYLAEIITSKQHDDLDFVQLFVHNKAEFETLLLDYKTRIKKSGMIWISWPKKSSGVKTDLDENNIRNFALDNGLVDVKVCAIDEVWSGLKLVFRLKDR